MGLPRKVSRPSTAGAAVETTVVPAATVVGVAVDDESRGEGIVVAGKACSLARRVEQAARSTRAHAQKGVLDSLRLGPNRH